jgi:hypothetical protein
MDALSLYAQQTRGYDPLAGYQRGVALAGQLLATQAQQQQQVFNNLFQGAQMVNQRRQFEANLAQRQEEVAFNQNMEERKLAQQQQQFDERMKLDQMRTGLSMANTAARMQAGALRTGAGGEVPRAEVYQSGDLTFARTYDSTGKFTDRLVPGQGGSASTPAQQMPLGPLGEPRPEAMQSAMQGQMVAQAPTPTAGEAPLPMVNIGPMGDSPNPLLTVLTPDMEAEADRAGVGLPATTEPLRTPSEVLGTAPSSGEFTGVPISSLQTQAAPATITQAGTLAPQEQGMIEITPDSLALPGTRQTGPSNAELVSDGPLRTQGQSKKFQNPQIQDSFQKAQRGEPQVPYFFKGMGPTADGKGGTGVIYDWVEGSDEPLVATINNGSVGEFRPRNALATVPVEKRVQQAAAVLAVAKEHGLEVEGKEVGGEFVISNFKKAKGTTPEQGGLLGYIGELDNEAGKVLMDMALDAYKPIEVDRLDVAQSLGIEDSTAVTSQQMEAYKAKEKAKKVEQVYNVMRGIFGDKMPMTKAEIFKSYGIVEAPTDPTQPQQTDENGEVPKMYFPRPKSVAEMEADAEGEKTADQINQGWAEKQTWLGEQLFKAVSKDRPKKEDADQDVLNLAFDVHFDTKPRVAGDRTGQFSATNTVAKKLGVKMAAAIVPDFDRPGANWFKSVRYSELIKAWARSYLTERGLLTPEGTRAQVAAQPNPAGLLRDETGTVQKYRDQSGATVKVNVR